MIPNDPNSQPPGQTPAQARSPATPQPGAQPPQQRDGAVGSNAAYKEASRAASEALYTKEVYDSLMEMARKNPIPALANTTVQILEKIAKAYGGLTIDEVFAIGVTMILDAGDALQQSGVEINGDVIDQALSDAITLFLQQNRDLFSPEEIQQAVQGLQEAIAQLPEDEGGGGGAPPTQGALAAPPGGAESPAGPGPARGGGPGGGALSRGGL